MDQSAFDFDFLKLSRRGLRQLKRACLDKRYIVGPTLGGDGTAGPTTGRQGKTGEAIVGQGHGKYFELASRGLLAFAQDSAGVAATATTISTVALLSLYNPINSGKRLQVCKVSVGYFSGTFVAGPVYHCVTPQVSGTSQTAPTGGALLSSYWSDINKMDLIAAPVGIVRTASTVVAPIPYRQFCSLGAFAGGATTGLTFITEDMDGEIVIEPGGSYQMQCILGTGTSPKLTPGISWAEIPFVASQG